MKILFLAVVTIFTFSTEILYAQQAPPAVSPAMESPKPAAEVEAAPGMYVYSSHGKRDPFTQEIEIVAVKKMIDLSEADFFIEGIIYDENGSSFAIINGKVLEQGNPVKNSKNLDVRVKKIEKNAVILEAKEGAILRISIKPKRNA